MEFGLTIPNRGPMATPEAIGALAAKAEDSGFVRLGVPDLMVVPKSYASRYPYDASGKLVGYSGECMEQLILMTHVAAVTKKIRILSAVMVVPRRPAVFTAKAVATMDRLSGGRIDLGVGAGWLREEFKAVGAPDFDVRGRVTDEFLEAFKRLWTTEDPSMAGEFAAFDGIVFDPKPGATPVSTDVGRWGERPGAAPGGAPRRRLVSQRRQSRSSAGHAGAFRRRRCAPACRGREDRPRPRLGSASLCWPIGTAKTCRVETTRASALSSRARMPRSPRMPPPSATLGRRGSC